MTKNKSSPFRASNCPVTYGFTRKGMIQPVYCGQWSCERCRKRLARDWANRARAYMNKRDDLEWRFWTFTMKGSIKSKTYAYEKIPKLWEACRKAVQRHLKSRSGNAAKWSYLAFVEGQPRRNNMPHFHVLSSCGSPVRIKDFAVRCGFGYQAKEEILNGQRASEYVAKYMSKAETEMPKGFRRARPSQDWEKLPKPPAHVLIVPVRGEPLSEFLVRVSDATGLSIEAVYAKWSRVNI